MFRIMLPPAVAGLPNQDTCTRPRTTQEKNERGGTDQKEKVTKTEREGRKEGRKRANKQRCVQTTASSGACFYRLMNGKFANL